MSKQNQEKRAQIAVTLCQKGIVHIANAFSSHRSVPIATEDGIQSKERIKNIASVI